MGCWQEDRCAAFPTPYRENGLKDIYGQTLTTSSQSPVSPAKNWPKKGCKKKNKKTPLAKNELLAALPKAADIFLICYAYSAYEKNSKEKISCRVFR